MTKFDNTISPWLNLANKNGTISNFKFDGNEVSFNIDPGSLESLTEIVPNIFEVVL